MIAKRIFMIVLVGWMSNAAIAQPSLFIPRNIQKAYDKQTRSLDGKPGKNYWQNKADYDIAVSFDPATRFLNGRETIVYTNNSSDTLKELWFKLYPNLYKAGSPRQSKVAPNDEGEGMKIERLLIGNVAVDSSKRKVDGTNMSIAVKPILPHQSITVKVDFNYILNKGSHNRTGEVDPGSHFVAYFFPRIAVYDDIDGWNKLPYVGTQEFYNDFCNFKTSITIPSNFAVWATGDLQNCEQVYNSKICNRIKQAEASDGIVAVIDSNDVKNGDITNKSGSTNTWKFTANNVTDFVFASSNHYVWNSTSLVVDPATGRRTRVDAVFNQQHKDFNDVIHYARKTVEAMSYSFPKWPFPYPHETVFDGLDQMEYPMMVNDNPLEDRAESIELTDHEIFHTMFPFYMGINETKYGWMDEGWATIGEWLISPMIDTTIVDEYGVRPYEMNAGTELDLPVNTLTTQQSGTTMFLNSYPKPAFGYLYIKDMLGDSLFTRALHYYIQQWNGKHPMPYDFFNCMNAGSGRNLNWFYKRWFFDDGVPNLAITGVKAKTHKLKVQIVSKGTKPVPIDLVIHFTDGSKQTVHRDVSVWEKASSTVLKIPINKTVSSLTLGSTYVPDVDKSDNIFSISKGK